MMWQPCWIGMVSRCGQGIGAPGAGGVGGPLLHRARIHHGQVLRRGDVAPVVPAPPEGMGADTAHALAAAVVAHRATATLLGAAQHGGGPDADDPLLGAELVAVGAAPDAHRVAVLVAVHVEDAGAALGPAGGAGELEVTRGRGVRARLDPPPTGPGKSPAVHAAWARRYTAAFFGVTVQ